MLLSAVPGLPWSRSVSAVSWPDPDGSVAGGTPGRQEAGPQTVAYHRLPVVLREKTESRSETREKLVNY